MDRCSRRTGILESLGGCARSPAFLLTLDLAVTALQLPAITTAMQQRLGKIVAGSVICCLAVGIPLSMRLAQTYAAQGYHGLRVDPFVFWLPLAVMSATTTYFATLTILVPARFFVGTSILCFGLAGLLAVVHQMFHDVGSELSEVLTPFIVHLVAMVTLTTCTRLLRFRMTQVTPTLQLEPVSDWRYPVSDLLLLCTGLAVFFAAVHQFETFWHAREGNFHAFLLVVGLCVGAASFATIWATLGNHWLGWAIAALMLVPLCLVPARQLQISLLFPVYWLGIFVAMHAGILALLFLVLRLDNYRLLRACRESASQP